MSWTLEELRDAAHRRTSPEPPPPRPEMVVQGLRPDGPGTGLVIDIDARLPDGAVHGWRLTFASMLADLERLPLDTAAITLRANVEEWRDTRNQYPDGIPGTTEERLD